MASQGEKTFKQDADGERSIRMVAEMRMTVESLIGNSTQLQKQSEGFNGLASRNNDPMEALQQLREVFQGHDAEHGGNLEKVKRDLREEFKRQYDEGVRAKLREQVREAIEGQVRVQIDEQIKEHIPVSLKQQAEETKKQLHEVKISLQNSESRTANSALKETDLYESLAIVLTPEGVKSKHYPADLCSLYAYDLETARALVKDYGLVDSEQLDVNFKRFLAHIGTHIDGYIPSGTNG